MVMTEERIKKVLRNAVKKAKTDGHVLSDIAADIGVPPRALYDLIAKEALSLDVAEKIKNWLRSHGYLEPDASPPIEHPPDVSDLLARDLNVLADMLRSPIPPDLKTEVFSERITQLYRRIQDYCDIIKKQQGVR